MSTIEQQRAELTKLLTQGNQSRTFSKAVAAPAKTSKEDAKKLAQLRMSYDLQDKAVMSSSLMPYL
jgi:hypothetical protein